MALFSEHHWRKATYRDVFNSGLMKFRFRDLGDRVWQRGTLCGWIEGPVRNFLDSYGGRWDECEVYCGPPQYLDLAEGDEYAVLCYGSK